MTMVMDDWVKSAMADDSVAAELLFQMKQSGVKSQPKTLPSPPPPPSSALQPTVPSWGKTKPRTKPTVESRANAAVSAMKNKVDEVAAEDSTRCSPTTPLSWNGGASPCATADGCDGSRSPTPNVARSKATATSEHTGISGSTKKHRKKKTFAELQEEESSLLKERMYLTKEIESINANFKAQRARNESLKRMKIDLGSIPNNNQATATGKLLPTILDQSRQPVEPSSALANVTENDPHPPPADSITTTRTESARDFFLLPDLNAMPSADDSYTNDQYGTR